MLTSGPDKDSADTRLDEIERRLEELENLLKKKTKKGA